ncbi:hypothetical protein JTE90_028621 [Oedothorax gibbosus]|uniref:Uncharacterized protein n=1 Tax=Oedothorax gibbosus TaxID=931172 RepID=A0AAV6TQA9_9ARAC|nr:hypothetical protein JTE90_028621 [Oedothorax gibbosus]
MLDIELSKAVAVSSLNIMEKDHLPGGEEEKLIRRQIFEEDKEEVDEENCGKVFNSLVTTRWCKESVRNEIIVSTKEFLTQRVSDDYQIIKNIKKFLHSKSAKDMIECSRDIVKIYLETVSVEEFRNDVIDRVVHFGEEFVIRSNHCCSVFNIHHYVCCC